jgi:methylglyoxal synthase
VKTLLRLAVLYDVPLAMSPATADLVIAGLGL